MSAFLFSALFFFLTACSSQQDAATAPADEATQSAEVSAEDAAAAKAAGVVQDPAQVVYRVREVGPSGRVPTAFMMQLTSPRFDGAEVGQLAPEGTVLRFEPPVEGALRITAPDTLSFEPATGFVPGQAYTATLETLVLGEETVTPPEGVTWTRSFEVPAFALHHMALVDRDPKTRRVQVGLDFTAAVSSDSVREHATFRVGDRVVRPLSWAQGARPTEVVATFAGPQFMGEVELKLALSAGVPYAVDGAIQAGKAKGTLALHAGKPVEILAVRVVEGVNGHYLEVVCKDDAAGGERWWWDPDTYDGWWTSRRCLLSEEEAQASVHIDPAVDFSVAEAPAGFRLFGDFERGTYNIRIDGGAQTVDGGVVPGVFEADLEVPLRAARLSFTAQGRYLPRSAWTNLAIRHLNVDEATLVVRHVPPENLVFWLSGEEALDERTSTVVLKKKIPLAGTEDEEKTAWIDVGTLVPQIERGVYEVRLSDENSDASASSRILLTDLQIVAKRAAPGPSWSPQVWVWALDSHSDELLRGVQVKLVRPSGESLASCTTGAGGGCTMSVPEDPDDDTPPLALIATRGDDLTYLRFADVQLAADTDVQGVPYRQQGEDATPYQAALWSDRGVYRPGDVAHVAALLRDPAHVAPDAGLPVVLSLIDPRGKELRRRVVQTDGVGLVTQDLPFADFATTGRYRVVAEVAERQVGDLSFNVEEFVPERMKVEASAVDPVGALISEPVPVKIAARWLFGGSAGGSAVELGCQVESAEFAPEAATGWHFGLARVDGKGPRPITIGTVQEHLGDDGEATLECPASSDSGGQLGAAVMAASVSVREGDSGRMTTTQVRVPLHPERYYLGTRSGADKAKAGVPIQVQGQVVDWQGHRMVQGAPQQVQVEILRLEEEYGWYWDDWAEDSRYQRLLRRAKEGEQTATVEDGRFTVRFTPEADAAGYLVVVRAGAARTEQYFEGEGRRYWWDPDDRQADQTPRPDKPGVLVLDAPEQVHVGDQVHVALTAPYGGRLLMTVETDEVIEHDWLEVEAGPVEWDFGLQEFQPNVYVSALLIKDPHLESAEAFMPERAYGVRSLRVVPEAFTQQVQLEVPERIQPYTTLDVGIQVDPSDQPVVATVAVVDEGILQLTRFQSPDPAETIFARRALGVSSFETVGWTMLAPAGGSHTGGDADSGGGRVQMVHPVALWSGPVALDAKGHAVVHLDIPGYRGELRVMAVTASAGRMGHADAQVTVRDPLVLQTTLPRFLVAGDIAQIPVFVSNMSGADQDVTLALEVEALGDVEEGDDPVVRFLGKDHGSISLKQGESGTVAFQITADRVPSAARIRVTATAGKLRSKEELELPLIPAQPEAHRVERVALGSGGAELRGRLDGWLPGSDRTTFWVSANPYAGTLSHMHYLMHYPYGCIEQTTSGTRPLLYLSKLMDGIDPTRADQVDAMVQSGIERVASMQTPAGGFSYWPGGTRPDLWGTAYASLMLLDAKQAGYAVPDALIDDAIAWLGRETAGMAQPGRAMAFAHYVLARAGKARPALVARTLANNDGRSENSYWSKDRKAEDRYLLMAALQLSGDRRYESELRDLDTSPLRRHRTNDWSYYSELRKRAMTLAIYQDTFGLDGGGDKLASLVAKALDAHPSRYYSTQELAWGITALGKRVLEGNAGIDKATLRVDAKVVKPLAAGGQAGWSWAVSRATRADKIRVEAHGAKAWLVMSTDGVRAKEDLPLGGDSLTLSRELLDAKGVKVDPSAVGLGDLLYVRLHLRDTSHEDIQNIALVDRIPAGWEIENPRLGRASRPDWVDEDDLWEPEHMNLRDDRLEVFGGVRAGEEYTVVYALRAVTAGTFTWPEAHAEAMYDPDRWARLGSEVVTVKGPWDGFLL